MSSLRRAATLGAPGPAAGGDLRRLFWRGLWEHAVLRWESAAILALASLGSAAAALAAQAGLVPAWSWLVVLPLCLSGEAALVRASLRDPESHRLVIGRVLSDAFRPQQLADAELRRQVMRALDTRARIEALIRTRRGRGPPVAGGDIVLRLDGWIGVLYGLATRLDRFKSQLAFSGDQARHSAARAQQLQSQAAAEGDPATCREIGSTIAAHESLMDQVHQVRKAVERADLRLEQSVSQLAAILAQTVMLGAQGLQRDRGHALCDEISAEVEHLRAMAATMDRLQPASAPGP